MRPCLLLVLLLAGACQERTSASDPGASKPPRPGSATSAAAPAHASAPVPAPEPLAWTSEQQACVDRWLAERKLDAFGSPQGTVYAGGTPLFDETTGQHTPRRTYLAKARPEALAACGLSP